MASTRICLVFHANDVFKCTANMVLKELPEIVINCINKVVLVEESFAMTTKSSTLMAPGLSGQQRFNAF